MNTLSTNHRPVFDARALNALRSRIATGVKRYFARLGTLLDDFHDRSRRGEHERFLANANDPYELERLERTWERRQLDASRIL